MQERMEAEEEGQLITASVVVVMVWVVMEEMEVNGVYTVLAEEEAVVVSGHCLETEDYTAEEVRPVELNLVAEAHIQEDPVLKE